MLNQVEKKSVKWMRQAIALAHEAELNGEVPVGAVIVSKDDVVIGQGSNQMIDQHDPTAHAEVMAIRSACLAMNNYRLPETTLYVTLEPCLMCAGAIAHARIERVVFAAFDPKRGAVHSCDHVMDKSYMHHVCRVEGGILSEECGKMLSDFFKQRRGGQ